MTYRNAKSLTSNLPGHQKKVNSIFGKRSCGCKWLRHYPVEVHGCWDFLLLQKKYSPQAIQ